MLAAACAAAGIVELAAARGARGPAHVSCPLGRGTDVRRPELRGWRRAPPALGAPGPAQACRPPARPRAPARRGGGAATVACRGDGAQVRRRGAAFVAALPAAAVLPGRLGPAAVLTAPAGAFVAPDAWLARAPAAPARAMAAELPEVLDLLHVAVSAGQPALRALGEVGRRRGGPLAAELRGAAARATLGVPHAHALERLARRCPLEDVAALVAAIARSERHGAPLAPALHALAADARAERAQRVRDRAARAAPKIQLVVALLLVPAVMLLVGACLSAAVLSH